MYVPKTHEEELLLEALITNTCFNIPFPTRGERYTAYITRSDRTWDSRGRLQASLVITGTSDDLMDSETFPIYLWVEVQTAIANTGTYDSVRIWWYLPPSIWLNDNRSLSERWPITPGPFLWIPE